MTESLGTPTSTRKLSIVARGRQLGTAAHMLSDRDQTIMSKPDLQSQLIVIMAGLAGERIAFGHTSTSVNDDLHAATTLARSMVTSFGMSDALGLVTIGEKGGEVFLGASLQDLGSVGPETLNVIDDEVERLVGDAEARAAVVLDRNWNTVEETANALLEQETLSGVALDAVLSTVRRCVEELHEVRPRRATTRHDGGRQSDRRGARGSDARMHRLPSPAMIVALVALVLSTTGVADAARHAVVSAIAGHPISAKPRAGGILVLNKNKKFPASAIPTVANAKKLGGKTAAEMEGTCPPDTVDRRQLVHGNHRIPADQRGCR